MLKKYTNYEYYTVRTNEGEFILALYDCGELKFDSMQLDLFLKTYKLNKE